MIDPIEFAALFRPIGRLAERLVLRHSMRRLIDR